jgi:DNA repair protein RecN (Recombination protein N)
VLRSLSIRDFALIASVDLEFGPGMTVLVGETGAGKSIVIDALAAALGDRLSADALRTGARRAVVEATFDVSGIAAISPLLTRLELEWEGQELILRRELSASGTSRCFVNDTPASATAVRELAALLMDFHGQHDTHGLLNVRRHRELLDASAGHASLLENMKGAWATLAEARKQTSELRNMAAHADAVRERCEHVIKQVGTLDPKPGEMEQLEADLRRTESREQVLAAAMHARGALTEDDTSAESLLLAARERMRELLPFDASIEPMIAEIDAAITSSKEASQLLAPLADEAEFSPEHLEQLRQRMAGLQRLARTYGTIDQAMEARRQAEHDLADLENMDEALEQAAATEQQSLEAAERAAEAIRESRLTAADQLEEVITAALREMGMAHAVAAIRVEPTELGVHGADAVEFLLSANAGEEPKPLHKVASGGELSRFMLALKSALVRQGSMGTLVFDEIDTGISGRVARHVGEVMKGLASSAQVLCVTHLPQIASLADAMIRVRKQELNQRTEVLAESVNGNEAVVEVARLLSGAVVTDAAMEGARELMTQAPRMRAH